MLLSIVIPTRNEARNISACLEAVAWGCREGFAEALVVDNASADDTVRRAEAGGARVAAIGPERSAQRNHGALRMARGDYVFFVDADMIVGRAVLEEIRDRLSAPGAPDALFVREEIGGAGWWIGLRNFERSFYDGTCIDGLRVIRRSLFADVGGYDETLFAGEDWDLDRRVLAKTRRTGITRHALLHNEANTSLGRMLGKKRYYGTNFDTYRRKWDYDATVRKQFGVGYRLWTVFMEDGKWRRSLRRPDYLAGIWGYKLLVALAVWRGMRRRPPAVTAP